METLLTQSLTKQNLAAQGFLPEAQLSSQLLAGLLARFSAERLPIPTEQWQKCSTLRSK